MKLAALSELTSRKSKRFLSFLAAPIQRGDQRFFRKEQDKLADDGDFSPDVTKFQNSVRHRVEYGRLSQE